MSTDLITWYDDITINGVPYPTRNTSPINTQTSSDYLGDLTDQQRDTLRAAHEAAHALAVLAGGGHIHYAKIATTAHLRTQRHEQPDALVIPGGDVYACNFSDGHANAIFFGAGERAEDLWLREHNLWTAQRAVGIELGAKSDRAQFLDLNPHFGFGADHNDYRVVHDLADELVSRYWNAITAVANVLATRLYLTGQEVADLARMPNGTHSKTCTYGL